MSVENKRIAYEIGSKLTTLPLFGWWFWGRFWASRSFRSCLIILASSLRAIVIRCFVPLNSCSISEHCAVGALRLLHVWINHDVIWRLLIYIVVDARSVIVDKIAKPVVGIMRMHIVVIVLYSVCVVCLQSMDVIHSLRNPLENCHNL